MAPVCRSLLSALVLVPSAVALHGRRHRTFGSKVHENEISFHGLLAEEAASEKLAAEEFDCADEIILRLAIAESFITESQETCVERRTEQAFEEGGSGARLSRGESQLLTCESPCGTHMYNDLVPAARIAPAGAQHVFAAGKRK